MPKTAWRAPCETLGPQAPDTSARQAVVETSPKVGRRSVELDVPYCCSTEAAGRTNAGRVAPPMSSRATPAHTDSTVEQWPRQRAMEDHLSPPHGAGNTAIVSTPVGARGDACFRLRTQSDKISVRSPCTLQGRMTACDVGQPSFCYKTRSEQASHPLTRPKMMR